jgi:tRNA (cmo5U34)-methyltransferase
MFKEISERLSKKGVLLIADLVEPKRPEARELFAATYDTVTKAQSVAQTGSVNLYEKALKAQWNYYRYPDPVDQPSPLSDQLAWLKEAGFQDVDCFWMLAGHAIYGGYKSKSDARSQSVSFECALRSAQAALFT